MNEMGSESDENCDDEFECSECDFKCTNEIDIIQHSAMHQSTSNNTVDISNSILYGTYIEDESNENDTVFTLQTNVSSGKEIVSGSRFAEETSEINALDPSKYKLKREPSSHEVISTTKMLHESEIGNRRIKLEDMDIDIKQESCPDSSSHQINEFVNIHNHREQDSLVLMPYKKEHIYVRESMHSAYDNVNISTEHGTFRAQTFVEDSGSISCHSDPLHKDISLTNTSQRLPPHKRLHEHKASIEVEIDNTGIYIPPGWKRKVFMKTTLCKGQLRYDCFYYTDLGKQIRCERDAYKYANKKHLSEEDIGKLNFTVSQTTMKPDQPILEVDLDNTGIYIPEGWQRKIYHNGQKIYHVNYLNAEGRRFWGKSDIYAYISNSNSIKENQIDVEDMDFSRGIKCQLSLKNKFESVLEQVKIIEFSFEVRKTVAKATNRLYLCKLCNFSSRVQHLACNHFSIHVHKFSKESIHNSVLPKNYDYFMCTECENKIMRRKDVQIHLERHCGRQITSTVVSVKCVCMAYSKADKILYCCEACEFACFRYSLILEHLKYHTPGEIVIADRDKYHKHKYNSDGNNLDSIYKERGSNDNKQIGSNNSDRKLDMQDNSDMKWYNNGTIKHSKPSDRIEKTVGKMEIKVDNTGKYIPEGWQRKVYKFTQGVHEGRCVVRYISPLGRTLHSKTQISEYIEKLKSDDIIELINVDKMDFSCKSHMKHMHRNASGKIEIKVDNTGKYIPEGWQRKAYKFTQGALIGRHTVRYISPLGKILCSKKLVSEYIEKLENNGIMELINVDKMDFSWKSHMKHRNTLGKIEIQADNTGKYIPKGWQRKAYKFTKGVHKGQHVVRYISPLGRTLCSKRLVSEYIERLESNIFMEPINVDKMDFSSKSQMKHKNKLGKIEIKVDNTGKYIPEGWQRKVYKFTKGNNKDRVIVRYISPSGKNLCGKTQISEYIEKIKSNGIMELINVDKMDFSTKSYREYPERSQNKRGGVKKVKMDKTETYVVNIR
ncbi:unnamed protein product [Meganyctiphanes norvegica]|uniref:MBD domain-containing protein n=1 Tax=Meganyctiphanes norvegica TaxID=48144 RepID=A0AAV2SI72_MEGNR